MRVLVGLVSLLSVAPAHIGSGDAVQPRDTVSVIESISPALPDGVAISVIGSDTYLRVESDGVEVEVPGYEGEPYLRIDEAGVVSINEGSMTSLLNSERYGNVDVASFVPSDEPRWVVSATDGVAMWHDHRSHWMSPLKPATIDDRGAVQPFEIAMVIDGVDTTVSGTLYLRERASWAWWIAGVVAGLGAFVVSVVRRKVLFASVVAVSALGVVIGALQYYGLPHGARITPVMLLFSLAALATGLVALAPRFQRDGGLVAMSMSAGAGATLVVTAWLCSDQVRAAYIPGIEAFWLGRVTVPVIMGVGIVAVFDGVVRIAFPSRPPAMVV